MNIEWRPIQEAPVKLTLLVTRLNGMPFSGDNIAIAYQEEGLGEWCLDHEPFDIELRFEPTHFAYLPKA